MYKNTNTIHGVCLCLLLCSIVCLSACFLCTYRAPWTLAVCFVMLPVLRQLLTSQTDERYANIVKSLIILSSLSLSLSSCRCVCVVCDVLHMILTRFSELILFSKGTTIANPLKVIFFLTTVACFDHTRKEFEIVGRGRCMKKRVPNCYT